MGLFKSKEAEPIQGWANWKECKENGYYKDDTVKDGIILGRQAFLEIHNLMYHSDNVVVLGDSGTGKTEHYVIPNIYQMNGNMVILDPYGKTLKETRHRLESNGYTVDVFDITNPSDSKYYNPFIYMENKPFAILNNMLDNIIEYIAKVDNTDDLFYIVNEKSLLKSLFLYVLDFEEPRDKNLGKIYEYLTLAKKQGGKEFSKRFEILEGKCKLCYAPYMSGCYKIKDSDKYNTVIDMALKDITHFICSSYNGLLYGIQEDNNMLNLEDYTKKGKRALFIIPDNRNLLNNLIIDILIHQICSMRYYIGDETYMRNEYSNNEKLPKNERLPFLHLILDGYDNIGNIKDLVEMSATDRKYNMVISVICRSVDALNHHKDMVFANAESICYMGGQDKDTINCISAQLDYYGIEKEEVLNLKDDEMIIFIHVSNSVLKDRKY